MSVRKNYDVHLNYIEIGQRIQKLRNQNGYKQRYIAEMTGISLSHISNIETEKTKPSLETLAKISRVLECTIDEMIFDDKITLDYKRYLSLPKLTEFDLRVIDDLIASIHKNKIFLEIEDNRSND